MKQIIVIAAVLILGSCARKNPQHSPKPPVDGHDTVPSLDTLAIRPKVTNPLANAVITSPVIVTGSVTGAWFFEASFPIVLYDSLGQIASAPATAQTDWMTTSAVTFEATLKYAAQRGNTGKLVLQKANPSGIPENADSIIIPVRFK